MILVRLLSLRSQSEYTLAHMTLHPSGLVQNQAATFDLARTLSDRSRRGLPCDRSRGPGTNQTKPPETTLGPCPDRVATSRRS
jgi:hypothetical protein